MPTLNIDVNARTERARKDLRSLDKEVLKLSNSEKILARSIAKSGNVGAAAFRQMSSAAVKQAKAINSTAIQFRQLRSQLQAVGAAPQVIGRLTKDFVAFRKVMERGTITSTKFQQTQDKFSNTLRTTARQFKLLTGEVKDSTNATVRLNAQSKASQAALARQAHALSNAKIQYKQLLTQMRRLGASKDLIRSTTQAFVTFSKGMKTAELSSIRLQRAQDKLKTSFAGTKRQLAATAAATNKVGISAKKGGKGITGLGTTLENLGSTAVLVVGPLSGIGSRLIAFGAIAKRGSIAVAALFTGLSTTGVLIFKSIKAFDILNLSLARTKAILKATGKEATITAEAVNRIAANVARETLANLEDTRPAAAALLSFGGINIGNLERVLTLAQDVSSTGLINFDRAIKSLGRSSEDPIANLDALKRVLGELTPLQKDQITNMQNMGRGAEAFGVILDIMAKKVGGVGSSQNKGLAGALDLLGLSWTELLESLGSGALYKAAVATIQGLGFVVALLGDQIREFKGAIGIGPSKVFVKPPTKEDETTKDTTPGPPSRLEKAFIDANTGVKRSFMDLDAEGERLRRGFSLISPEILKLAEKHKSLDDIVKILTGDFSGLNTEGRRVAKMAIETNNALIELERKKEAFIISKDARPALEKYNDELKELIFLYDNSYISLDSLNAKHRELQATLENATPGFEKVLKDVRPGFEKALTNANAKVRASLIELNSEEGKLRHGFSLMSPEILKLADKYKLLDDVVKVIAGDFGGLTDAEHKAANMLIEASDGMQNLERKRKAFSIIKETRPALEKYNDAMRELTSLYAAGAIKANNFAVKQGELRAALESTTPELNILTSASEKFGDSLADLLVKGEDFSSGLKSIFKSLVDDIQKQFFKLAVINPILNGIFGASASRPGMGSQGGGASGLGGAGGLLGMMMGGSAANDNAPKEGLSKVADDFGEEGRIQSQNYGKSLAETNKKMGEAGGKAASNFSGLFANMAGGVASAVGGGIGSFLGNAFADLLGFQHGGSFKVGGSGGRDSQLVAFKASPREKVSVETPGQQSKQGGSNVTYIDARGVDPGQMSRLIQVVKDLDESVEVRAVNATVDARDRNTSLFGRTL